MKLNRVQSRREATHIIFKQVVVVELDYLVPVDEEDYYQEDEEIPERIAQDVASAIRNAHGDDDYHVIKATPSMGYTGEYVKL